MLISQITCMLLNDYSKSEYLQTGVVHKKGSLIPPGKALSKDRTPSIYWQQSLSI